MDFEDPRESKTLCPLDGHRLGPEEASCFNYDCTGRSLDKYYMLHGHRCYCEVRRWEIEQWHKKRVESARKYKKMEASQQIASEISIDDFYAYCDDIDKEMIATKQKYVPDMSINPYHAEDERCLVYLFSGDKLVDTGIVTNPFSFLSTRFDKIMDPDFDAAINICAVPASIAEAVNVRVRLIRNMDVTSILHHDNPVYIKSRGIAKYVDAAYGWDWLDFDRMRKRHLEMTEISNFGNVIYLKPELDQIIRREYKTDK